MPVHAFVDESVRPPQYLVAAAIVEPSRVRQECMAQLVQDLLARQAHRLVIDTRNIRDAHDERTLRAALGSHPSMSRLVYEHVDSTSESLLWIADVVAWCFGAGRDWRKRIDPIVNTVVDLG
jgi:hypothetical protein